MATPSAVLSTRARVLVAAGLLAGGASFIVPVVVGGLTHAPAAPNPPGNNGTVKIDGEAFDDHPNNEPHVGCTFQVDFYGFDEGDLSAAVTFEAQAPTGKGTLLLEDEVFIGEDDNSGGGSEAGLDASQTYTLDLSGIEPHPNQGWHVKLTVNADGSQGADVKHKVFWVTDCAPPPTTSTSSSSTTSSSTTSSSTTSTSTPSSTSSSSTPSSSSSTPSTSPSSTSPPSTTPPSTSPPSTSPPSSSAPSSPVTSAGDTSTAKSTPGQTAPGKDDHPTGPPSSSDANGHG
jgi:hypothetical protein